LPITKSSELFAPIGIYGHGASEEFYALKKPCCGFYVIQNILSTSFEIDQSQNIIDTGNGMLA
jgi:hypothetical protein